MNKIIGFISLGVAIVLSVTFATYIVLTEFHPEDELRRMLIVMSELETVRQKTALSWTEEQDGRVNTTIYASGQIDLRDVSDLQHGTQFRVVRLTEDRDYSDLSGEIRTVNETTYLTYAAPGPEVPGVDFSDSEIWVSFLAGDLPSWGSILPGIDIPVFTSGEQSSWRPDAMAKLRSLLRVADVFHVTFDGEMEEIDGVETRVMDARFDSDAIRAFLREMLRIKHDRQLTDGELLQVEAQARALERMAIRLWVGVEDHRLYQLQAAGAVSDEEETRLIPIDVFVNFSGFNEPFEVERPEARRTKEFADILRATFTLLPEAEEATELGRQEEEGFVSSDVARLPTSDVEEVRDVDGDGLDDVLEFFYGTNPENPDTDGDGVSDGEEVVNGRNPRGTGSLFGFGLD